MSDFLVIPLHRPDQHDRYFLPLLYLTELDNRYAIVASPAIVVMRHHKGGWCWQGFVVFDGLVGVVPDNASSVDDDGPSFVFFVIRLCEGTNHVRDAADEGHVLIREVVPCAGEVVDGVGGGGDGDFVRPRILRAERALGIDGDAWQVLEAVFGLEAFLD